MGIFADLFKKKADANGKAVGNVEDFVPLTRVYFQSVIAVNLGITNIRFLPDVAQFKRLFRYRPRAANWDWAKKALPAKC